MFEVTTCIKRVGGSCRSVLTASAEMFCIVIISQVVSFIVGNVSLV